MTEEERKQVVEGLRYCLASPCVEHGVGGFSLPFCKCATTLLEKAIEAIEHVETHCCDDCKHQYEGDEVQHDPCVECRCRFPDEFEAKVTPIEDAMPHVTLEVMCWKCGHRWIAVKIRGSSNLNVLSVMPLVLHLPQGRTLPNKEKGYEGNLEIQ